MKITIERSDEYQGALKNLVLAQSSEKPLEELLEARTHLIKLIHAVREVYIEQADGLLTAAGASGEIEVRELMSETEILTGEPDEDEDEEDYEGKSKGPVGFKPNPQQVTGD